MLMPVRGCWCAMRWSVTTVRLALMHRTPVNNSKAKTQRKAANRGIGQRNTLALGNAESERGAVPDSRQ